MRVLSHIKSRKRHVIYTITAMTLIVALAVALFITNKNGLNILNTINPGDLIPRAFVVYASEEGPIGIDTNAEFIIKTQYIFFCA